MSLMSLMLNPSLDRRQRDRPNRTAIAYLVASNATALSIIENQSGCAFRVGTKLDPRSASVHWLPEADARPVMRKAPKLSGRRPDIETATAALVKAAAGLKVVLTDHGTAMVRAGEAAERIERFVETLRASGKMREFTRAYKRRRMAATARGEGFMSYGVAELRLRRARLCRCSKGAATCTRHHCSPTFF
jgi:hypothetical protein